MDRDVVVVGPDQPLETQTAQVRTPSELCAYQPLRSPRGTLLVAGAVPLKPPPPNVPRPARK